ncbi:YkyA family protein [Macrococcus carouselicus]|nr:YkyA family protein [Macrococcus carouselicus]
MKKIAIMGLSVLMLAGCGHSTDKLAAFYTQIDTVNQKEKPVIEVNKNLQKLESEKVERFNKISQAKKQDIKMINSNAQKLVENTEARKQAIDKEIKAYDDSETAYRKAKDLAKDIKNKEQKKEAADLTAVMDEKYAGHDELMASYQDVLKKENDLFKYLEGKKPETEEVNSMIEKLNKSTESFQQKMTSYNKTMEKIQKESADVVKLLNSK